MTTPSGTEFLVAIDFTVPEDMSQSHLDALRVAESVRARELSAAGHLVRLWRVPGRWANWGLWRAADEVELRELLASLPLFPLASITVHPTEIHPNDPGSGTPIQQPADNEGHQPTWPKSP